jgi:hypothetical protein
MRKGFVAIAVLLILAFGLGYGFIQLRKYIAQQHTLNQALISAKRLEFNQGHAVQGSKVLSALERLRVNALLEEIHALELRDEELDELPTSFLGGLGLLCVLAVHSLLCWMVARRKKRNLISAVLAGTFFPPLALGYYYGLPGVQTDPLKSDAQSNDPVRLIMIVLLFNAYGMGYIIGRMQKPIDITSP